MLYFAKLKDTDNRVYLAVSGDELFQQVYPVENGKALSRSMPYTYPAILKFNPEMEVMQEGEATDSKELEMLIAPWEVPNGLRLLGV